MTLHHNGNAIAPLVRYGIHHESTSMNKSKVLVPMESSNIDKSENAPSLSPCPLCDEVPLHNDETANNKYPVLCSTAECNYNLCSECLSQLLTDSQEKSPLQGSDGNKFNLKLHCPNCRGHFCVKLEDVLLLRRAEVWSELKNVNDMDLSASDLREKHYWDEERLQKLKLAETRYSNDSIAVMDAYTKDDETLSGSISVRSTICNKSVQSSRNETQQKIMKELDNMMLAGLEDTMTEAERKYLISFMTSGCPNKLAQAAELVVSLTELKNTQILTSLTLTQTFDPTPTPSIPMNRFNSTPRPSTAPSFDISNGHAFTRAKSMQKPKKKQLPFRPQSIMRQGASIGYVRGGLSTSSLTARNPSHRTSVDESRQWRRLYPLPIRMPHAYSIPLDFDPYLRWGSNLSFLDDFETFGSFHKPPKSKNMRENIVKDAFERLSVGMFNNIWKEPIAVHHVHGLRNLLSGTSTREGSSALNVPYRRVIVSCVRGPLRQTGIQVGDVVTHVNGEAFDGSAEKLRWIMSSMRSDENLLERTRRGIVYPKMQIVVNAEIGTAEVLRLRSNAAKAALERSSGGVIPSS